MAINSITGKTDTIAAATTQAKKAKPETGSTKSTASSATDKIDMTALTQDIKKALESAPSTPVIDNDKVAAVKEALRQGSYEINADSIAEKILQLERPFDST